MSENPSVSKYHPNIPALYEAAERFGFKVDTRGIYPTMIRGVKAKQYRTHRDMLDFISVSIVPCMAPECINGKVFGETCRRCKGTGQINLPRYR